MEAALDYGSSSSSSGGGGGGRREIDEDVQLGCVCVRVDARDRCTQANILTFAK